MHRWAIFGRPCGTLAVASPEIQQRVRDMQEESAIEMSNQSKERALVGEVISTVRSSLFLVEWGEFREGLLA